MLFFQSVLCDVFTSLSKITSKLKYGSVEDAAQEIIDLYNVSPMPAVESTYHDIMMKTGRYEKLKGSKFENTANELIGKRRYLSANYEILYHHSPCDFEVVKVYILSMLRKREFSKSYEAINKARASWPNNEVIEKLTVQHHLVRGDFSSINSKHEYTNKVRPFYEKFQRVKHMGVKELYALYEEVILCIMKDNISPSIFIGLKYDVLKALVKEGIASRARGMTVNAKELLKIGDGDYARYTLLVCMIYDDLDINEELNSYTFKDNNYRIDIERKLEMAKEDKRRKEEKKKEKEQQERQKQRDYSNRGARRSTSSDDPSGYYKIMGVPKNAAKGTIKKRYYKLVREKDPDKYLGKDEKKIKELSEEMMKINEAKEVLLDDKKRDLYDRGLYNGGNKQQHGFQGEDINDIFKSFFGGGGFGNGGFSGSGGRTFYFSSGGF